MNAGDVTEKVECCAATDNIHCNTQQYLRVTLRGRLASLSYLQGLSERGRPCIG